MKKLDSNISKVFNGNVEGGYLQLEQENARLKEENKAAKILLAVAVKQTNEQQKQLNAAKDRGQRAV